MNSTVVLPINNNFTPNLTNRKFSDPEFGSKYTVKVMGLVLDSSAI
jgi:hypothetical protein